MRWKYLAGPTFMVVLAAGCTGGDEVAAPDVEVPITVVEDSSTSSIDAVEDPSTTTAVVTSADAPSTLAFSSASDIGRLYEIDGSVQALTSLSGDAETVFLSNGLLVQATGARNTSGELWVRLRGSNDEDLGWVKASELSETTQTIDSFESDDVGQLREVRAAIVGDALNVHAVPGSATPSSTLRETEIAMHGGNTTLTGDGQTWVDIVDSSSRERLGWTLASSFTPVSRSQVKTGNHQDVSRRADNTVTYGATLPQGRVSVVGCNASQVTFDNTTSLGLTIVFGTAAPIGREAGSTVVWRASGGSKVYVDPGESVVFTLMTGSSQTWHFAALDADDQASNNGVPNADDRLVASNVQEFFLPSSSCAYVAPPEPDVTATTGNGLDDDEPADVAPTVDDSNESESTTTTVAAPNEPTGPDDSSGE